MKIFRTLLRSMGLFVALVVFFGTYFYLQANVFVGQQSSDSAQTNNLISIASAQSQSGDLNPTCMDNYQTWTNSTTFKADATWSTAFVTPYFTTSTGSQLYPNTVINNFERDINGDGLPDYVYVRHQFAATSGTPTQYYTKTNDCVYTSNGSGWTLAYRCASDNPSGNTVRFYGDCAG